jgi:hypothetical protein
MYEDLSKEDLIEKLRVMERAAATSKELEKELARVLQESGQRNRELSALMQGARAVLEEKGFADAARAIFDYCKDLIGATSGYVALLSDDGQENEVLFLESGGLPCTVDPDLPMPIRGLRAEAYQRCEAVYDNEFMHSKWVHYIPGGHVVMKNVLFAPLLLERKTVGVIGLANKETPFSDNDAKMATVFGELAAIALQNSRNLDRRIKVEKDLEKLVNELKEALAKVKMLSGLLPICSACKKIRDDKGYWSQIEEYIREHSEADFSHGICPECARELYPDMEIED